MYDKEVALSYLEKHLEPKRVQHSIRVMNYALELNEKLGLDLDPQKVEIAALLHDCGKWANKEEMLKKAESFGIIVEGDLAIDENLVHGVLGNFILQEEFGIYDRDVLDAVRYHITGRWSMTDLDMLVYLADFAEPGRTFEDAKVVRSLLENDLKKAMLCCLNLNIKFLIDKNVFIAPESMDARNYLIIQEKKNENRR